VLSSFQHRLSQTRCQKQFSSVILLSVFKARLKTFLFNQAFTERQSDLPPAPLKLRPYCTTEIQLLLLLPTLLAKYSTHIVDHGKLNQSNSSLSNTDRRSVLQTV